MARYYKAYPCCIHCSNLSRYEHRVKCHICPMVDQKDYKVRLPQAKDIPDSVIYGAMRQVMTDNWRTVALLMDIQEVLAQYPPKVVLAKLRTLVLRRKTIDGCVCGCRGDFEFVKKPEISTESLVEKWLADYEIEVADWQKTYLKMYLNGLTFSPVAIVWPRYVGRTI